MTIRRIISRLLGAALVATCFAAAADELTDRAKRLLERKQARQAYQLLLPQEAARAGDPEYDHLLAIAALEVGDRERAVFALERVLAVQPNNHVARADIARAYLALGEREAARKEFETVRSQAIPQGAKANIDRFLAAIQAADTTRVDGFVELAGGYDSNVNAATRNGQVALPALGGIIATLDPSFTKRGDGFGALAAGINFTHKLSSVWSLVGNAGGSTRLHADETRFDQLVLDGTAGARWASGKEAVTVGAQVQSFELDWARYRQTTGVVAQWQHASDERRQASLFGQYAALRYPSQSVRDADRTVLGAAYGRLLNVRYTPLLFASAYAGREDERAQGVPHLGHDLWGLRLGLQLRLGDGWGVLGNLAYEERRYGGPEPIFLDTRKDRQADAAAGVSYLVRANTTLLAQVGYTDNRSNVPINRFDRTLSTLSIRVNF